MSDSLTFHLEEHQGLLSLESPPEVFHRIDEQGQEILLSALSSPYPESSTEDPLARLLLASGRPSNGTFGETKVRTHILPLDFITLPSLIKDVLTSHNHDASLFANNVFEKIGRNLEDVRAAGQGVPVALNAGQIIISRVTERFHIVPPLELVVGQSSERLLALGEGLIQSLGIDFSQTTGINLQHCFETGVSS